MKFVDVGEGVFLNLDRFDHAEIHCSGREWWVTFYQYARPGDDNYVARRPHFNTEAEARAWLKRALSEEYEYKVESSFSPEKAEALLK